MKHTQKLRPVKKIPKEIRLPEEKIPVWSWVFLGLFLVSLILLGIARASSTFAEFFNQTVSAALRVLLAMLTNPLPFSLAELLIVAIPLLLFLVIRYAIKHKSKTWRHVLSYTVSLLSVASLLFSSFVLVYGMGYHTPSLSERIGLEDNAVTAKELSDTAKKLVAEINDSLTLIRYEQNGASVMPYSLKEMNVRLMTAYKTLNAEYPFVQSHNSRVKPVLLSTLMSYSHFTGFYTFFTGEANLNVDFPDYTLPFTAAHEFAHGRGIARENEANFVAFLVCTSSEDAYIRYCGLLNMYEYVASALYEADTSEGKALYREVSALLDERARGELLAYSTFFDKYRDNKISEISGAVNDSFLKANGTEEGENIVIDVDAPVLWNDEKPSLYTFKMWAGGECIVNMTALKRIEIVDGVGYIRF